MKIFFDPPDTTKRDSLALYRWKEGLQRWVSLGGVVQTDHIELSTSSLGLFSLFINRDNRPPKIEVTVEGQAFANGDFVPSRPVISALYQDVNGIDIDSIQVFLDGSPVPTEKITYPSQPEDPNAVPVSALLELGSGSHSVRFEGYDLNGNSGSAEIQFQVVPEFRILRAGCYPNPVTKGKAIFTFTLTDRADEADLRIYTTSGRLVKSFDRGRWGKLSGIGYHEVEWNLLNLKGKRVGNGVYFVLIRARKGDEKIKMQDKLAVLR